MDYITYLTMSCDHLFDNRWIFDNINDPLNIFEIKICIKCSIEKERNYINDSYLESEHYHKWDKVIGMIDNFYHIKCSHIGCKQNIYINPNDNVNKKNVNYSEIIINPFIKKTKFN